MRNKVVFLFLLIGSLSAESDSKAGNTAIFQLAEDQKEASKWNEAIPLYLLRIEKEGDREELWASKYGLASCYDQIGQWSDALFWYLEAFDDIPTRSGPLLEIAVHYRLHGENDLAYIFSKHGSRIFSKRDFQFDQELSIVAYYTRFKEDGYKAASDLVIRKDVPWHIKDQTYKNLLFYTQNLKNARFLPIDIDLPLIEEWAEERYHPMNPSIQKTKDGYKVICRAVNYTQIGAKEFHTIDPQGFIRTRNFLVSYDTDFNFLSQAEIIEDLVRERSYTHVLGHEDCRIFQFKDHLWFTSTTRDTNRTATPQVSLCKLRNGKDRDALVEKLVPLLGPDPNRCEKNWLPFVHNGSLNIIYSYDPFTIYKPNLTTGECEVELSYEPTHDFTQFKGSAGPIEYENGYLLLVHETVHFPDNSRVYLHRLLYLDNHFYVKQVSKPFTFLHQGIEFCSSMTLSHNGSDLIFAIGIEDEKAYLCLVDLKTIRSLLTPLQPHL